MRMNRFFKDLSFSSCVLLATGSFNPIHRSHIDNLQKVKAYLEKLPQPKNVLAAYISPTQYEMSRD